jgi:serine O-acetyltransferase
MDERSAGSGAENREFPGAAVSIAWACRSARALFHHWLFRITAARSIIDRDLARWVQLLARDRAMESVPASDFVWLIVRHPEFRNLFYHRVARERRIGVRVLLELAKLFYKPLESLYLFTEDIGPGCFIQHGFSTGIGAKRIGENFWVNQQVSIGFSGVDDFPVIGDNVSIKAGAIVLGDITIGDNAVVGAGAVVLKSVPPNCTVVGVPAHIVKRNGIDVHEELV